MTTIQQHLAEDIERALYDTDTYVEEDARREPSIHRVEITASDGNVYYAVILTPDQYDALVR